MKVRHFLDRANLVTLIGLTAGWGCALLAISGRLSAAVVLLMTAGMCDLIDGSLARGLQRDALQRRFGAQLDSLADACAFGFAPAILLFAAGARAWPEVLIQAFLLVAVVWRLARFDTLTAADEASSGRFFIGLPCTCVALVLPALFVVAALAPRVLTPWVFRLTLDVAAIALALAMLSRLRVPKPGRRWYPVFLALGLLFVAVLAWSAPIAPR